MRELRTDPAIEHIPVIMLTAARSTTVDMQNGLNLGADDYITKPFDRLELLARIRTKLRVKSADDLIRQRNRELSILIEIGRQLSARLNMDELADLVLRRTVETLGAYMGHVMFLGSKHPIHRKHSVVTSERSFETQLPPVQLLADWVRETRESILIKDIRSDQRWQGIPGDPNSSTN